MDDDGAEVRGGTDAGLSMLLQQARAALKDRPDCARAYLDEMERLIAGPPAALIPIALRVDPRNGLVPWQIRRIDAHIDRHIASRLKVKALADLLGLSAGHFSRAFKACRGEPPQNHIIRRRVRAAQSRMLTTDDPLSEIAGACGFTDQAHMSRMFRRLVGKPPFQWRKTYRRG